MVLKQNQKRNLNRRYSVTSFPHTHLCRSHIIEPNRSPIAILSCWFDSFNLKFLPGMTFNHWEPNLSWNALNLFTSVGSSRKIKSAISLSKIDSVQFFLDFIFVTFARKYISTENKARSQDDWSTSKQSSTCFSASLPKPVLLVVFLTSDRQKRYCSPASTRTFNLTCLHAKSKSSWLGLSIPSPRGHSYNRATTIYYIMIVFVL